MRVLVTGYRGQLGFDVVERLKSQSVDCRGVDQQDFDLTDAAAVDAYVSDYRPDCIVHCAAFTNVDKAETERALCHRVNVDGTRNIALAAERVGAAVMYFSTDYVFSGKGDAPWKPTDPKAPCNFYGESKLGGEEALLNVTKRYFILRTSWVFGINGHNFVKTMLRLGAEKEQLSVVDDQIGSPTYTYDLARLVCDLIQTDRYGIYHATNEGFCSWYDFASEILRLSGRPARVLPVSSEEYARLCPTAAVRPKNSRLDTSALTEAGFSLLPTWQEALIHYLSALGELK